MLLFGEFEGLPLAMVLQRQLPFWNFTGKAIIFILNINVKRYKTFSKITGSLQLFKSHLGNSALILFQVTCFKT